MKSQREETLAKAEAAERSQALMVVNQQALAVKGYMEKKVGKLRTTYSQAGRASVSGYQAGKAAGQDINLGGNAQLDAGRKALK